MRVVYLAGGYGFNGKERKGIEPLIKILEQEFEIINPFERAVEPGFIEEILELEEEIKLAGRRRSYEEIVKEISAINFQIGRQNHLLISKSDIVFIDLDGVEPDAGACCEGTDGYHQGKKVYGYRDDFRPGGENSGCQTSLQVEFYIKASGGRIFGSHEELKANLHLM